MKQPMTTYTYQRDLRYFVKTADGIQDACAEELAGLGAGDISPEFRGIHFKADTAVFYHINYLTRLASRCLAPLVSFGCPDTDVLYRKAKQLRWEDFFVGDRTFAVSATVSNSRISHSKYASLRLKDAIADYFREKTGRRPDVSVRDPDILLHLHIRNNRADISLDASGGALHRRGYREETGPAPMQETVAAAIIHLSQWDGSQPLYDPMCGSGTLLCEALMRYCRVPSGIFRRRFGFECLPDFDAALWQKVKKQADAQIRKLPENLIAGSDLSQEAVDAARVNIMGLNDGKNVRLKAFDFNDLPALEGHIIVTNPPYGIRMGKDTDLDAFYKRLGDFLKQKCNGSAAYIYFGDRKYIKKIGLKTSWKKPIKAGGLDGRLAKYELY
ncbi:MAG: class I SAM-dependent RNA methyltransferase [Deltaproteobacteria bacterium]|nr:MAG: class I SAM-dependent RNA methyltransferase [Deltaproteobacteria bacterium]